jgi:hypothetical protein
MPDEITIEQRETALVEDHLNLRRLPPVAPVDRPTRFSQTLLRHSNICQRAGYLYVRHHGGMPAHALDRGTAYHMAKAKVLDLLLDQHGQGVADGSEDEKLDEHSAKLMLEEVIAEHPEFTIPLHERDELRVMMVHLANGLPLDVGTIAGIERKFVLQLGEHTISGILDLACIEGLKGIVRDSKTEWHVPPQSEYDATFQGRLYAVLLVYGNPVSAEDCASCEGRGKLQPLPPNGNGPADCSDCEGRGYIETLEPPLGERLEEVDVGELFPRHLHDEKIPVRNRVFRRLEIDALRRDLESQCHTLAHAFETGQFPATSGSHCSRCPCEPECPLPRHLRRFAGAITTDEQAKEAAAWHMFWEARLGSTRKELKLYCKANDTTIRFGADLEWREEEVTRSEPADWEAIEQATRQAAETGELIDVSKMRVKKLGTEFRRHKLTGEELAKERGAAS